MTESKRKYYERIKEKGLCRVCKKRPAEPGKTRCPECAAKWNAYHYQRYHKARAEGICVICNDNPARKGKTTCLECGVKASRWAINHYNKRKENENDKLHL